MFHLIFLVIFVSNSLNKSIKCMARWWSDAAARAGARRRSRSRKRARWWHYRYSVSVQRPKENNVYDVLHLGGKRVIVHIAHIAHDIRTVLRTKEEGERRKMSLFYESRWMYTRRLSLAIVDKCPTAPLFMYITRVTGYI